MKIEEHRSKHVFENMLPLVNVVFLLLIFFMVAGAFNKPELFNIDAPKAQSELAAERKILTILMNQDGQLAVNDLQISKEALTETVQQFITTNKHTKVQLKADANSKAVIIVELMELLNSTDLQAIHLLTTSTQ